MAVKKKKKKKIESTSQWKDIIGITLKKNVFPPEE